jgi:chemotaxis protein methyltransferase CheR
MTPAEFQSVCTFVRERSAIVLEPGKEYLVESRLTPIAKELHLNTVGEVIQRLNTALDNGLATRIVEAMVTTETSFFRDLHPFEGLRKHVLPDLIARRQSERTLNIWCAATSTGQEPYSLVMLLREHFPELVNWRVSFLSTDLSADVLNRARAGRYNQIEVNRGLPVTLLMKYFRQHGTMWELNDEIRRAIEFRELNLAKPWPYLPRMDLILLRNVMIYFDVPTKKSILSRAARLLKPDGYLLLGGAETTLNLEDSLRRVEPLKGGFFQLVG